MHYPALVGVMHGPGQRLDQGGGLVGRQRAAGQHLRQAGAFHELQDEVGLPLLLADLVDVDDVGVLQTGDRQRLAPEAAHLLRAGQVAGADHLEGNAAAQPHLPGLVHHAHPAPAHLPHQLEVPDRPWRKGLFRAQGDAQLLHRRQPAEAGGQVRQVRVLRQAGSRVGVGALLDLPAEGFQDLGQALPVFSLGGSPGLGHGCLVIRFIHPGLYHRRQAGVTLAPPRRIWKRPPARFAPARRLLHWWTGPEMTTTPALTAVTRPDPREASPIHDAHTLELLEFDKVRELLAGYAACSLGKERASSVEPGTEAGKIRHELALVTEMATALGEGQAPPFAGLHDVRLTLRRAAIGAQLSVEQLLEVADTLSCTGNMYRYRMRLSERHTRLIEMLAPIEDMGPVAKTITGCIDSRGNVLDMASRELAQVRQKLADVDSRVQSAIRRLLADPELRKILRYPNATVSGDHYVLPVAVNHRHKLHGVVHRTSPTGETVFIEPSALASLSAERAVLKGEEDREVRRILRRLSGEVARVAKPLAYAVEILAKLDLITSKARFSRDFHMYAPEINTEGK